MRIVIAEDFSNAPGARYESEGPNSGEKFRKELLLPNYLAAEKNGEKLEVNFDGCYGFATSFLEESFGGLIRELKKKGILQNILIVSNDDVTVRGLIEKYVKEAEEKL